MARHIAIAGNIGAGKTTLFVELIRRVRAYLTRKRERLQEMVRDELRGGIAASSLSDRLKQLIFRINKVVFGFKQCATTGAAAVVVGNKCVTINSLHAIPISQTTKKVSDETHKKKSDNYRRGPLTLQQIADYQDMFQKAGCFMVSIDEVSHIYFSILLIFYYYLNSFNNIHFL
jgi:RecA/RadA recombinase